MKDIYSIIRAGLIFTGDKTKLFFIVMISTLLLTEVVEFIFSKVEQQNQLLYLVGVLLIENFLTCGVYGSLRKILSKIRFTVDMFFSSAIRFFFRFLVIKLCFVFFVFIFGSILLAVSQATGKISLPAASIIVVLWLIWLAFPAYYFVLALYAPVVLFSQDTRITQAIKTSIIFCKRTLDKIIVIAFFYFILVGLLVYLPEKAYNLSSTLWTFFKSIVVSIAEIGFISCLFLLYEKESDNERNV